MSVQMSFSAAKTRLVLKNQIASRERVIVMHDVLLPSSVFPKSREQWFAAEFARLVGSSKRFAPRSPCSPERLNSDLRSINLLGTYGAPHSLMSNRS